MCVCVQPKRDTLRKLKNLWEKGKIEKKKKINEKLILVLLFFYL